MASSVWKGHLTFGLVSFPDPAFQRRAQRDHQLQPAAQRRPLAHQAGDLLPGRGQAGPAQRAGQRLRVREGPLRGGRRRGHQEGGAQDRQGDGDPGIRQGRPGGPDLPGELLLRGARRRRREALRAALPGPARIQVTTRVAKVAMHNREHIIVLRPGAKGILSHTMYYQDEIRQVDEFRTDTSLVKDKELDMAKMLISSLEADFEPQKYHDTYRDNLQQDDRGEDRGQEGGGDSRPARGPGDRHHGSAQEEPGRKAQAGAGGHRGRRAGRTAREAARRRKPRARKSKAG